MTKRKTHKEFVEEMSIINPNIIILGQYISTHCKILCKCKIDGHIWEPTPASLLSGSGCPICASKRRRVKLNKTHEEFVLEASIKNPTIKILGIYINSSTKILCECTLCGHKWNSLPGNILSGHKCPICTGRYHHTHEDFMQKFNSLNDVGDYEVLSEYIKSSEKMLFLHKTCNNKFEMIANNFLRGQRCPFCSESKGERKIENILNQINVNYIKQKTFDELTGINNGLLSYDFYLPNNNLLIEYQGEFHDGNARLQTVSKLRKQQEHDRRKRQYAKENNIKLLEIWYWDFDNIECILEKEGLKK